MTPFIESKIEDRALYEDLQRLTAKRKVTVLTRDVESEMPEHLRGMIGGVYMFPDYIWLNPRWEEDTPEYTLAHELGHYSHVQRWICDSILLGRKKDRFCADYLELRADRFANKLIALLKRKRRREDSSE